MKKKRALKFPTFNLAFLKKAIAEADAQTRKNLSKNKTRQTRLTKNITAMSLKKITPAESKQLAENVVNDVISPDFREKAPDDLQRLAIWRNSIRTEVHDLLRPVVGAALLRSPIDPEYAHSPTGRAKLLLTAHHMFLERVRKLSREEAIFLLAYIYGELVLEDLV